jgi:hypothetical protein
MGIYFKLILLIFVLFVFNDKGIAQNKNGSVAVIQELDSIFEKKYSNLFQDSSSKKKVFEVLDIIQLESKNEKAQSVDSVLFHLKKEKYSSDIGLEFKSNYLENINGSVFNFEDNLLLKRRFQAGLEIDLLKEGYYGNKQKAKKIEIDNLIFNQTLYNQKDKENYLEEFNFIIQLSNKQKINVLNVRRSLLSFLQKKEEELLYKHLVKQEELLDVQKRIAQVDAFLYMYSSYNSEGEKLNSRKGEIESFPVFDLNDSLIVSNLNFIVSDTIKNNIEMELAKTNSWLNQIDFSTFARYNYYDMLGNNPALNRSFFSVGFNFSSPIPLWNRNNSKIEMLEINKKIEDSRVKNQLFAEEMLNEIYEFRYKLQQFVSFYYKKKVFEEQVQLEYTKRALHYNYFSPIKALKLIDDVLAIEMELIELKQNLYLKLIKIQDKLGEEKSKGIVREFEIEKLFEKKNEYSKAIYIWSSLFKEKKESYLFNYVIHNKFDKVILACHPSDPLISSKLNFISLLYREGVKVELMFGNNDLINIPSDTLWMIEALKPYNINQISSLHLDVEPQALIDWKDKKNIYLYKYLSLVKTVNSFAKRSKLKLSVSIPFQFTPEVTEEILATIDQVTFMCYENIDTSYLDRKLLPYLKYHKKINIALRTEDFKGRKEMEKYADGFVMKHKFNGVVFHDLKRLIQLDEFEIKK